MSLYLLIGAATLALMRRLLGFVNAPLVVWSLFGWPVVLGYALGEWAIAAGWLADD